MTLIKNKMQFTFKNIAAISDGITQVSALFVKSNPKEIAVLYFHTARVDYIEPKTKLEFKRLRNCSGNKSKQRATTSRLGQLSSLINCFQKPRVPALYQVVSSLS